MTEQRAGQPTAHLHHLRSGACPAVHSSKAWCKLPARHSGEHWAPYLLPDGSISYQWSLLWR